MREVIIQIPTLEAEQNIDIDVRINGKNRTMHYRVEIIDWKDEEETTEEKISVLSEAHLKGNSGAKNGGSWRLTPRKKSRFIISLVPRLPAH